MNILFHAHEFNIKEGGPCTKRIDSLATYLANNNYNVTILTSSHNKKNEITTINRKYKKVLKQHNFWNNLFFLWHNQTKKY